MATSITTRVLQLLLVVGLLCSTSNSRAVLVHRGQHAVLDLTTFSIRHNTSANIHPVLGVAGLGINTTAPRLEIRELQRNPDLFNIYLLGLQRWQNTSQEDKLSYFQVAGMLTFFESSKARCSVC